MSRMALLRAAGLLAVLAFAGAMGCAGHSSARAPKRTGHGHLVGSQITVPGLESGEDEPIWFAGRVTIIDLWATWCGPCVRAMPTWAEIHHRLEERGAEVVAISVDEDRKRALAFVEKHDLPFRVLWDPNGSRMETALPWLGVIPTTMVVDCAGKIRSVHQGYGGPEDLFPIADEVESLLGEASCMAP